MTTKITTQKNIVVVDYLVTTLRVDSPNKDRKNNIVLGIDSSITMKLETQR